MISKYSVKKPFTVLVGVILVIVLGVVSLSRMTTDLLPDMSFQYALIITTDMGASPQKVESDVTAPIESAMATTSNIKHVSSMSYNSYSIVTCEYEQDANMDSVVIEIQQKIEQVKASWSDGIGTPTIMQINPDMLPIMMTAVDMDGKSESEITDYVENELIPAIESTEGVASVTATGELTEQIEVTLDQNKIDALNEKIHNAVLAKFDDAREKLDSADSQIKQGQSAISNASDQISEGVDTIKDQKTQLSDQKSQLESTLAALNEQKSQLETIQSGISSFMNDTLYTETIPSLEKAKDMPGGDAAKASLEQIDKQIAEKFSGLSELGITVNGYADMPQAASTVAKTLVQVNTGIEQCQSGLEKISEGEIALNDAMDELNSQAAISSITIGQQSAQLATAAASLENSKTQLEESENSALDKSDLNTVLSIDTLSQLLTAQNFDMPAGYVNDADGTQYIVQVGDKVKSVDDLNNLVLMDMNMDGIDPIRVSDVANVEITDNSGDNYAVINGNPGIILSMEKQTGYSTGDVTDRLLDKFDSLEKQNDGLHTTVLMNQGIYIDMVVSSVLQNMIVGAILAIIVLFLFLKDIKPTLVIAASIPLSVIVAVVLMYFTNITLNIISMSGLVLGIGMLVDNSIVVIENIYRLRGEGYSVKKSCRRGCRSGGWSDFCINTYDGKRICADHIYGWNHKAAFRRSCPLQYYSRLWQVFSWHLHLCRP